MSLSAKRESLAQIHGRYQRAADLLEDVLAARRAVAAATPVRTPRQQPRRESPADAAHDIQSRLKARLAPAPRFCWHCRKPLHARSDRCPFCGEAQ